MRGNELGHGLEAFTRLSVLAQVKKEEDFTRRNTFVYFEDENPSVTQTWGKRGCFAMASLGRHAWVLEPDHLRKAVAQELLASAERYAEEPAPMYQEDSERRTS